MVSSHLRQVQGNAFTNAGLINAGLRLDETGCDDDDFRLDSDCCDYGKNEPVDLFNQDCRTLEVKFIELRHPSEQCLLVCISCTSL